MNQGGAGRETSSTPGQSKEIDIGDRVNIHTTTIRPIAIGLALLLAAGIAACGGDGAKGPDAGQAALSTNDATVTQDIKVALIASSTTLASDGLTPVELTAVVTDPASGVALAGQTVAFAANDPKSAVRVEVTQATTDASGVASARLFLNNDGSERDIRVLASVGQRTPSELTVRVAAASINGNSAVSNNSRGELTVRLGTDNLIEDLSGQLAYRKRYAAIVTDSAGIPKPNATVLATLRGRRYYVGYYALDTDTNRWFPIYLTPTGVASEDTANYGICDAGEDANGDAVLTPGNVASYTVSTQTDANGLAVLNVVYPKSFGNWVDVSLEVTATVGGTEGFNSVLFQLPMAAADLTNAEVAPPSTPRTFGSLSTAVVQFAPQNGLQAQSQIAGSPFPYQSVTPSCN